MSAIWFGQREDQMEVPHGQQLRLARRQPCLCRTRLALGAVAVAAGIIGDVLVRAVLAARNMAAERRRAAALDRAHHLHLIEADVACVGRTPGSTMGAEDIRNLQLCPLPTVAGYETRLSCAFLALLRCLAQVVQRALHRRDHAGGNAGIPRCRGQLGMAKQRLYHSDIDTASQAGGWQNCAAACAM